MTKLAAFCLCVFLLCGCSAQPDEMESAMALRTKLLQAEQCTFDAVITADYGNKTHKFAMTNRADSEGTVSFTVMQPESIAGISGKLSANGGELIFDETALHFELLAEDQLSPVSTPWILIKTLRSGYLTSAGSESDCIHLTIDDTYEEDALQLDIWLNSEKLPEYADILYDGRRILSIELSNFQIL